MQGASLEKCQRQALPLVNERFARERRLPPALRMPINERECVCRRSGIRGRLGEWCRPEGSVREARQLSQAMSVVQSI